jgi:hypothetical protein
MTQPKLLTGVDADVSIGGNTLTGARWMFRETTDFLPANRLGTRFKTYGMGQTAGILTVSAPWEENVSPFDEVQVASTGPVTISVDNGNSIEATCDEMGVAGMEVTTDADGVTIWLITLIAMGVFNDFTGSDADARAPGPNE